MKSTIYSLLQKLSSIVVLVATTSFYANACGPYPPLIPTPKFFTSNWDGLLSHDFYKQENLRLWQQLTSERIPLKDIEQVVYGDDRETVSDMFNSYKKVNTDNLFYTYLRNTEDSELYNFLLIAKELEERRREINSPWYYPSSRNISGETGDFQDIIDKCNAYKGSRIKDRYALQAIRALFASRCYDKCIEYFNKAFQESPDTNLFKRMAKGYVAGCWSRLGNVDKANEYFVQSGDFYSIKTDNPVAYMSEYNPDSPELMSYIQTSAEDSAKFCLIAPIANNVLHQGKAKNRGDWEFILAYIEGEYHSDYHEAARHIDKALRSTFSTKDLRDHARAYRMKVNAENGNVFLSLTDLKWMESKIDMLSPDANEWNRIIQNIVYVSIIPKLWERKDYTTAILLCGYADNLLDNKRFHYEIELDFTWSFSYKTQTLDEMRKSERYWNFLDYSSLSFQLMGSLSSEQLIRIAQNLATENTLYAYLRKYARTDSDYINELIGTLALREENYQRAAYYFATVSDKYQRTMNITKAGYLNRDPFYAYPNRWEKSEPEWEWESRTIKKPLQSPHRAKYKFAKRMLELQHKMKYGKTSDERGLARLKYAIGRRNSFEECWALTQYWRGYVGLFEPALQYWDDNFNRYDNILYDYEQTIGHNKTEELYQSEIKQAMAMIQSDETKAEAEYILGNLRTIVKYYGNTTTAQHIKKSCDNWRSWL